MPTADQFEQTFLTRTALVKAQLAEEAAARDIKTARLRALRLAAAEVSVSMLLSPAKV